MAAEEHLLIGDVARRAGLRPSAIRYYESIGLLPEPERHAGRRRYAPEILRTLAVIAAGQRAGLSLDEVGQLLDAQISGQIPQRVRAIAERKLPEVEALIDRALSVKGWLQAASNCHCPTLEDCPLFDSVSSPAAPG